MDKRYGEPVYCEKCGGNLVTMSCTCKQDTEIMDLVEKWKWDEAQVKIKELQKENERYKKALREIADKEIECYDNGNKTCIGTAREALEGKKK